MLMLILAGVVQIQELVIGGCGAEKLPVFEQFMLKVTGRKTLSSRNKKLAFRIPAGDYNLRTQQVLPFCERFPFQGKLQRRWKRQKPQIIRFRLFGLSRRSKRSPQKKTLLAEFQADLAPHLDHLFSLDAPPQNSSSLTVVTTPDGPVHALQPQLPLVLDRPRAFPLHIDALEGCNYPHTRLSILLDSIHIIKRESRVRRSEQNEVMTTKRLLYRGRPQRLIELVRTVPLMYRQQEGVDQRTGLGMMMSEYAIPSLDVHTDSESASDSSSESSSNTERQVKQGISRHIKKKIDGAGTSRKIGVPVAPAEINPSISTASTSTKLISSRRSILSLNQMEVPLQAERLRENIVMEDEDECKPPVNHASGNHEMVVDVQRLVKLSDRPGCCPGTMVEVMKKRDRNRYTSKLPTIPDEEENDENKANEIENDADDEDDRHNYSYAQSELDHRDAIIAALRAENRAQAALISQLQAEIRRLRVEAACREPGNVLLSSMSTSSLAPASARNQESTMNSTAEAESATDSELVVTKRSASVPFLSPQLSRLTRVPAATSSDIIRPRRASARSSSAAGDAAGMPEETVFEGLVQEIQEEFRCLLPSQTRAISSA